MMRVNFVYLQANPGALDHVDSNGGCTPAIPPPPTRRVNGSYNPAVSNHIRLTATSGVRWCSQLQIFLYSHWVTTRSGMYSAVLTLDLQTVQESTWNEDNDAPLICYSSDPGFWVASTVVYLTFRHEDDDLIYLFSWWVETRSSRPQKSRSLGCGELTHLGARAAWWSCPQPGEQGGRRHRVITTTSMSICWREQWDSSRHYYRGKGLLLSFITTLTRGHNYGMFLRLIFLRENPKVLRRKWFSSSSHPWEFCPTSG